MMTDENNEIRYNTSIEELAEIINQSSSEIHEKVARYNDNWIADIKSRGHIIEKVGQFLENEFFELEKLVDEMEQYVFGPKGKGHGCNDSFEKLDEFVKHLIAIRVFAESKRYLEVRNYGLMGRLTDGSD